MVPLRTNQRARLDVVYAESIRIGFRYKTCAMPTADLAPTLHGSQRMQCTA